MKECRREGELRAYLDRELTGEQMELVAAHLAVCGSCRAAADALTQRATRVSALLQDLEQPGSQGRPWTAPVPVAHAWASWRWIGLTAAVAAGLLIVAGHSLRERGARAVPPPATPPTVAAVRGSEPQTPIAEGPTQPVQAVQGARKQPSRPRRARARKPEIDYFLALDNEPIESGTVVRVGLGPAEVPADVVIDAEGRARAIRLVSYSAQGERR